MVNVVLYRQSYNETLQKWNVPKRREVTPLENKLKERTHTFLPARNLSKLWKGQRGYFNAIKTIQKAMEEEKDARGRPAWATIMTASKKYYKTQGWMYVIFLLTCQRIDYRDSIHGVW